jgi:hypothetical protein
VKVRGLSFFMMALFAIACAAEPVEGAPVEGIPRSESEPVTAMTYKVANRITTRSWRRCTFSMHGI